MDIDEIRDRKGNLERNIQQQLIEFTEDTGVEIASIEANNDVIRVVDGEVIVNINKVTVNLVI